MEREKVPDKQRQTTSAIVPVFDEAGTVGGVIKILLKSPLINEVIAVNDGSTDRSLEILKGFGKRIKLTNLRRNRGKGFALASGIRRATGEIVTFWDADFTNLTPEHIETVLKPLFDGTVKAVVGYIRSKTEVTKPLGGQRAYYKRDLLPYLDEMSSTRFGVEIYLNGLFKKEETAKILLKELNSLRKEEKYETPKATKEYIRMWLEIIKALAKREDLLSVDIQILNKISETSDSQELKSRIKELQNKDVKELLEDYVLKYIREIYKPQPPKKKRPESG